ncbi:transposase [Rhodohalobacter sulfatireducens]|uniref:Transposase n=1 Tax=Rhodohalobacter sulfatireducens TaxID=2911366 RepID=A0ABS9KDW4_9BACT|nr:transposase [Rhodohalobacter sulfatireducens]MCG2589052.1 transposase [Rhodohalobacter sulfatireducens]
MSWVRIWIHLVFCTKNREPFLSSKDVRREMFQDIKANAKTKSIWLDCINGYQEHAHCLISLGKEQNISKVAQLIKGESSFWINRSGLLDRRFTWQDDYWAVSVSESHLEAARTYIHSQEKHHGKVSFNEEIDEFMEKYGWERIKG